MTTLKSRVAELDRDLKLRAWLESSRHLESFTDEQLEELVIYGRFPDPLPEPPPPGMSSFDTLDRSTLLRLWRQGERDEARFIREIKGRDEKQLRFELEHGHWPEEACHEGRCLKPKVHGGTE